jgi:hypothetical protein
MQQKYWDVPIILTYIGNMIHHLTLCSQQPKIQGYYAVVTDTSYTHMNKQSILLDLLQTGSALQIFLLEIKVPILGKTYKLFEEKMKKLGWRINSQVIRFNEHSDAIYGDTNIISGLWKDLTPSNIIL